MIKFFKQKNKSRGFTLVETLVAISIFTVSILGLMSILASSISDTNYAKQKIIASYLAQEGIEYVRNMRDTAVLSLENGWTSKFLSDLNKCNEGNECGFDTLVFPLDVFKCVAHQNLCKLYINNGDYNSNSVGSDSGFTRKVWMISSGGNTDEVQIFSKVEWTQGSGPHSITFSESLFNWIE